MDEKRKTRAKHRMVHSIGLVGALFGILCVCFHYSWSFDAYVTIVFTIHKRIPAPPPRHIIHSLFYVYTKNGIGKYTQKCQNENVKEVERKKTETEKKKLLLIFVSFPFCSDFFDRKMKNSGWDFQLGIYLCTSIFFPDQQ